jgi:hypothetical protein
MSRYDAEERCDLDNYYEYLEQVREEDCNFEYREKLTLQDAATVFKAHLGLCDSSGTDQEISARRAQLWKFLQTQDGFQLIQNIKALRDAIYKKLEMHFENLKNGVYRVSAEEQMAAANLWYIIKIFYMEHNITPPSITKL